MGLIRLSGCFQRLVLQGINWIAANLVISTPAGYRHSTGSNNGRRMAWPGGTSKKCLWVLSRVESTRVSPIWGRRTTTTPTTPPGGMRLDIWKRSAGDRPKNLSITLDPEYPRHVRCLRPGAPSSSERLSISIPISPFIIFLVQSRSAKKIPK